MTMDKTRETMFVALAFTSIGTVASIIICLCIRRSIAIKHKSPLPPGGRMEEVKLELEKIDGRIINEILIMYTSQRLKIITKDFKEKLGEGGYGIVYKGELGDGVHVAVKVLRYNLSDQIIKQQFEAEVNTIRKTRHPNLVRLFGFCFDKGLKALVYEFMENGSLNKFLCNSRKKNSMGFKQLLNIAIGTARGIAYLHEDAKDQIIHYDIKAENILLDNNFSPKVSDFGLAKLCRRDQTHHPTEGRRGTPGYAAPEMWLPFPVTHKCDVYSFGMLLFEILGRRRNLDSSVSHSQEWLPSYVWKKFNEGAMDEMMVALRIEEKDKGIATKMAMVALWCIHHRPEVRPLMSSVVKMLEGRVVIDRPLNPFRPPMTPVRLDLLQNVGGNIPSASSASSNWIAAFSTDNSYASSASHNWITPLSREDYIFLR
eukprot:TRINITY_DN41451_c0_g1_i1.p1 TRINITY_DN41451_c0_g1~~TRINITY_DN41451_c0_g1_i1.p1  ORF type:complete len:428 (+),score=71.30 TRINITY_DN41451_c0_g1_i1:150-1433(+)